MALTNTNTRGNAGNHRFDGATIHGDLLVTGDQGVSVAFGVDSNGQLIANGAPFDKTPFPLGANFIGADIRGMSAVNAGVANSAYGCRFVVPRAGTLAELAIWVGTSSGNIDVGVYDATVTPRTKLYSSGSTACPAASSGVGWRIVGTPALAVTRGQLLDFVLAPDNATATFGRAFASVSSAQYTLPAATWLDAAAADGFVMWAATTSFPLPATITPTVTSVVSLAVIGRLA